MKFATTLSFTALLAIANAATFLNLMTIRSGSQYQYLSVVNSKGSLEAGAGDSVNLILNDDSSLVDHDTNKYISVNSNKELVEGDKADTSFSISGTHLLYKGKDVFEVDPSDNKLVVDSKARGVLGVALYVENEANAANNYPSATASKAASKTSSKAASKTSTKAATKTSTAAAANASSPSTEHFGLVSIASGSELQYAAIKKVDTHTFVFSVGGSEGSDLTFTLKDDTTLIDQDGKGIYVNPATGEVGEVAPNGRQAASTGFSVKDGDLQYNGASSFKACPSGEDKYSLTANYDCTGGVGIGLKLV